MPYVRREESSKRVDIVGGQPRQSRTVHLDYVLRVEVNAETQPVAILEAKAEDYLPDYGLEQAKAYTKCKRFNVPFIYASNGHLFVEFDRYTGHTSKPRCTSFTSSVMAAGMRRDRTTCWCSRTSMATAIK